MYFLTFLVSLNSIDKVKKFTDIVNQAKYSDVVVTLSAGRYVIDGKSIMGIFSLNITELIYCELSSPNTKSMYDLQLELDMNNFIKTV